jgi:Domain of Unknown Function (DUF326)
MSYKMPMLITIPRPSNLDISVLVATIDALDDCARACIADADSDLNEQNLSELVKCIRLCLDCADLCAATIRVTSRQTEYDATRTKSLLETCTATCKSCGDECERHAQMHDHCRVCAVACRRCEQACRELLAAMN